MSANPQIISFSDFRKDLKKSSGSWPVDEQRDVSNKQDSHLSTVKIPTREQINQWFTDPEGQKIYWTKPEYIRVYKRFIERRYEEINSLQEKLRQSIKPEVIQDLETNESKRRDFFADIESYIETIQDLFKLSKQKEGKFTLTSLNNIIDSKKTSRFLNLVSRYEHNTRTPIGVISNSINIFNIVPQLFQGEMLGPFLRGLQNCFDQIESLFKALRNPSHQADPIEFNIDKYLSKLENEYKKTVFDNDIKLNWTIEKRADLQTFTNDSEKIQSQILDNLIENAIQHLNDHPDLTRKIDVQVLINKEGKSANTMKFIVSNPSKITDEQLARLSQFKMGFSTKTDKSKSHGIALVTAKELCESALGGEFEVTRSPKGDFQAILTVDDLSPVKNENILKVA